MLRDMIRLLPRIVTSIENLRYRLR